MAARNVLATLILTSVLSMAPGHVYAETSAPLSGSVTITAAWAGIWDVYEETHSDCSGGPVVSTRTYRDTLCEGDVVQASTLVPHGAVPTNGCDATLTDTDLQARCTYYLSCNSCCITGADYAYTWTASWHLTGDVATTDLTATVVKAPGNPRIDPLCASTQCTRMTGTRTRRPDLAACGAVPALRQTWGRLKLLYR